MTAFVPMTAGTGRKAEKKAKKGVPVWPCYVYKPDETGEIKLESVKAAEQPKKASFFNK